MSEQMISTIPAIQRLPAHSHRKEVEGGDASSDDENDNRKCHNFKLI